jgi:seryl-tRNA synthetase
MLLIDQISNDKRKTLKGLEKRGFKNLGVIDEIIELNNIRKKTQQETRSNFI